jgi:hypothetical protein
MTRLRIRRLRISGLSGAPPSRIEVASVLRSALETVPPGALGDPLRRIEGGRNLASAASSLAVTLRGRKEGGT